MLPVLRMLCEGLRWGVGVHDFMKRMKQDPILRAAGASLPSVAVERPCPNGGCGFSTSFLLKTQLVLGMDLFIKEEKLHNSWKVQYRKKCLRKPFLFPWQRPHCRSFPGRGGLRSGRDLRSVLAIFSCCVRLVPA